MIDPALERMTDRELAEAICARWFNEAYLVRVIPLVQKRMTVLSDFIGLAGFMFVEDLDYTPLREEIGKVEQPIFAVYAFIARLESLPAFTPELIKTALDGVCGEYELVPKAWLKTIRMAVTGRLVSTPLYETIDVLGKERAIRRLSQFAHYAEWGDAR